MSRDEGEPHVRSPGAAASWVGRSRTAVERIGDGPLRALAATLDLDPVPERGWVEVPPGWHWLYFLDTPRASRLGTDGHEMRGDFLPPVDLPRRMWAGGTIRCRAPLEVGEEVRRTSTVGKVEEKVGRTGPLVFVSVRHRLEGRGGLKLDEEQNLVYRMPQDTDSRAGPPHGARGVSHPPAEAREVRVVHPDPVLLFRFSALTFNAHRIHYDHPYATREEGYPGLVVHGPLLALLLLDAGVRQLDRPPELFSYRARGPLFCGEPFHIRLSPDRSTTPHSVRLWASHAERGIAMEASVR